MILISTNHNGHEEQLQRLNEFCSNIDVRGCVDGYSVLHMASCHGRGLRLLLSLGADAGLVGFNPNFSPFCETPISLSMYHSNKFVNLRDALKEIAADIKTFFDQTSKIKSLHFFHWTKETLIELFSEDLDFLPLLYRPHDGEFSICLRWEQIMVQPYWMRILMSITINELTSRRSQQRQP